MEENFDHERINWLREKGPKAEAVAQQLGGLGLFMEAQEKNPKPETAQRIDKIKEDLIVLITELGGLGKVDEILGATGHKKIRDSEMDLSWVPENLR